VAATAYGTMADFALYMKDVNQPANTAIANLLLSSVSRWVDNQLGQYFYSDGYSTKYFDGAGSGSIETGQHKFYGKIGTIGVVGAGATSLTFTPLRGPAPVQGDALILDVGASQETVTINGAVVGSVPGPYTCPITATAAGHAAGTSATSIQVRLAYFENQPLAQWVTNLAGNGIAPPTNYMLWPRNPRNADSSADPTQLRPWEAIDIARIPISQTQFLPSSIPGYLTVAVTANWGWPVVPDPIRDFTARWAVKMWRSRAAGWTETIGNAATGEVHHFLSLNAMDEATVLAHDYKQWAF
jgi:hypothetical protein